MKITPPPFNDSEELLDLIHDLWSFLNDPERVVIKPENDGYFAGLGERVTEALNIDE